MTALLSVEDLGAVERPAVVVRLVRSGSDRQTRRLHSPPPRRRAARSPLAANATVVAIPTVVTATPPNPLESRPSDSVADLWDELEPEGRDERSGDKRHQTHRQRLNVDESLNGIDSSSDHDPRKGQHETDGWLHQDQGDQKTGPRRCPRAGCWPESRGEHARADQHGEHDTEVTHQHHPPHEHCTNESNKGEHTNHGQEVRCSREERCRWQGVECRLHRGDCGFVDHPLREGIGRREKNSGDGGDRNHCHGKHRHLYECEASNCSRAALDPDLNEPEQQHQRQDIPANSDALGDHPL